MMRAVVFIISVLFVFAVSAENIYESSDSVRLEQLMRKMQCFDGEKTLFAARCFLGVPYVAGTLEQGVEEPLIINTREFDCTTFVESVAAAVLAVERGDATFAAFCRWLECLRYRGGVRNGYESRLHYISEWVADAGIKAIMDEVYTPLHTAVQHLNLDFMSKHPGSYPRLMNDSSMVEKIAAFEQPFRGVDVSYIPKELLDCAPEALPIADGDIIALVTAIDGLDVSHVGFAFWRDGKLSLLHASSSEGMVVADSRTLYEYMKGKKNHLGIRVFRLK